jgi:hypothetical protein
VVFFKGTGAEEKSLWSPIWMTLSIAQERVDET